MSLMLLDAPATAEITSEETSEVYIRNTNDVALDLTTIITMATNPLQTLTNTFATWGIHATPTGISIEVFCEELATNIETNAKETDYQQSPVAVVLPTLRTALNNHFGNIMAICQDEKDYASCPKCEMDTLELNDATDESMDYLGTCILCDFNAGVILN